MASHQQGSSCDTLGVISSILPEVNAALGQALVKPVLSERWRVSIGQTFKLLV